MASSKLAKTRLRIGWQAGLLAVAALLGLAFTVGQAVKNRDGAHLPLPVASPDTVIYRYRFGGEIVTHYLNDVAAVTEYRRPEVVDQVVFNLKDGRDYVLNTDILVDYTFPSESEIEQRQVLNQLYHHYDPYLQPEKQEWHHQWVDMQYLQWAGRIATYDEWIEALNDLTRGVEHHQMEHWIQYSPAAVRFFVNESFKAVAGGSPQDQEVQSYAAWLLAGASYEDVEQAIASKAKR